MHAKLTVTDFEQGKDTFNFVYYIREFDQNRNKKDFIDDFDLNNDDTLSRADGLSGATASGDRFAFSQGTSGESVLTLNFLDAEIVLQGADALV